MFREASRKAVSMKEEEKKRKKRRKQLVVLREEEIESEEIVELVNVLEGLKKEGKYVDLQVCPRCKSPQSWHDER